jgi:hypothetical protein
MGWSKLRAIRKVLFSVTKVLLMLGNCLPWASLSPHIFTSRILPSRRQSIEMAQAATEQNQRSYMSSVGVVVFAGSIKNLVLSVPVKVKAIPLSATLRDVLLIFL